MPTAGGLAVDCLTKRSVWRLSTAEVYCEQSAFFPRSHVWIRPLGDLERLAAHLHRMSHKPKHVERSASQLRVMKRRWHQRAWFGVGISAVSGLGLVACWSLGAHGFWWFLSFAALVSAMIEVAADINAYRDTKKRIADMESASA